MKAKSSLIVLVAIIIVVIGTLVIYRRPTSGTVAGTTAEASTSPTSGVNVVPFSVEGGMYYFNPNEIRVKQGDRVRITFTNVEGMHDLVIDEFNVKSKTIQAGESDTVEFLADKKGTFQFYCSIPTHRQKGMVGNLIIE